MRPSTKADLSDDALSAKIDREKFDAVMKKLLKSKRPITKREIADRVKVWGPAVFSRAGKRSGQR